MKFEETPLSGAYLVQLEKRGDDRGFFARSFCEKEFSQQGLESRYVQMNHSMSSYKGTLRGLHYQIAPMQEVKVVRCIKGRIWDCIVDLRKESPTFGHWFGAELSSSNRTMMYVPKDFAHAFLSLEDECEVLYQVSQFYAPDFERGIRWNDPFFKIKWPLHPAVLSQKDQAYADYCACP